jgi:hypothetical protein
MNTSRILRGSILPLTAILTSCRPAAPPPQYPTTAPYVGRISPPPSDQHNINTGGVEQTSPDSPPTINAAEVLAQRAQNYADLVKPADRNHPAPKAVKSDWPDPQALRLTPPPGEDGFTVPGDDTPAADSTAKDQKGTSASPLQPPTHVTLIPGYNAAAGPGAAPNGATAPAPPDLLTGTLARRAKEYPQDLSAQMDEQLDRFLHDEPVPDMESLAGLASEDRELLDALMDALTNFRNQLRADNNMLFTKKIGPLAELGDRLRGQAELSVPTVALCTKVSSFGVYEPIDPARFVGGKEHRVVLYCEVENFLTQLNDRHLYETQLTENAVLYMEESGQRVWADTQSVYSDLARRRHHDFFMPKRITLPANLANGRYLLKVTVEDKQARHIAENTVPIEIVSQ